MLYALNFDYELVTAISCLQDTLDFIFLQSFMGNHIVFLINKLVAKFPRDFSAVFNRFFIKKK
jgi:hypothetical protein